MPGDHLCKRIDHIKAKDITFLTWPRRASSPKFDLQSFLRRQAIASHGRCSTQAREDEQRREERGKQQAPAPHGTPSTTTCGLWRAQSPIPVPQDHGHGGLSIMERFKRMAPPSFKGESQPLLAES
ncbi:hypothetical protein Taro_016304 [Colocasia esculenta]|uniref:Uncharacterized protein n=1 Tax=Colocasia esculenta TaxID=4460 RepID=A0A843UJW5_COLES|nr:hypothetical protein [Colocasia esculenta]